MRILALDTALGACSVALVEDGTIRARRYQDRTRGHAEVLMDLVSEVEDEAGFCSLDCDRLAVTVGPGTFTGLRVSLAAARGLALATGLALVGVTTLQAIAAGAKVDNIVEGGQVIALLDAKRGEVYGQIFAGGPEVTPITQPLVLTHERAEALVRHALDQNTSGEGPVVLVGTGASLIAERIGAAALASVSDAPVQPDAAIIAKLAAMVSDPASAPPVPLYLRDPDAKLPSRNPLIV